ncbi:hypothetical protein L1887_56144 [Cichorium endivia]|nr:hypothetical protein L1887_56144 [Cichorium endivia]
MSRCKHIFCRECVRQYLDADIEPGAVPDCPYCHAIVIDRPGVGGAGAPESTIRMNDSGRQGILARLDMDKWRSSTKIEALVEELTQLRSEDKTIKSLVFSQFVNLPRPDRVPAAAGWLPDLPSGGQHVARGAQQDDQALYGESERDGVPGVAQGGWRCAQPDGGVASVPDGSVVESVGGGAGDGPHPPSGPASTDHCEAHGDREQHRVAHHRAAEQEERDDRGGHRQGRRCDGQAERVGPALLVYALSDIHKRAIPVTHDSFFRSLQFKVLVPNSVAFCGIASV